LLEDLKSVKMLLEERGELVSQGIQNASSGPRCYGGRLHLVTRYSLTFASHATGYVLNGRRYPGSISK